MWYSDSDGILWTLKGCAWNFGFGGFEPDDLASPRRDRRRFDGWAEWWEMNVGCSAFMSRDAVSWSTQTKTPWLVSPRKRGVDNQPDVEALRPPSLSRIIGVRLCYIHVEIEVQNRHWFMQVVAEKLRALMTLDET